MSKLIHLYKWSKVFLLMLLVLGCMGKKVSEPPAEEETLKYPILGHKITFLGDTVMGIVLGVIPPQKETIYLITPIEEKYLIASTREETVKKEIVLEEEIKEEKIEEVEEKVEEESEEISVSYFPPEKFPTVKRGIPAFTLQIGAFKEKRYADKLYWGLKKKYGDIVYIGQIGEYWKVRIGEYFSLEEARSAQRKFRSEGFPNTWIVRIMR